MAKKRPATSSYYPRTAKGRVHRVVVERALGHPIPAAAQVHHVNEDVADVSRGNLVLCQDAGYHKLLHRRQQALDACGNANWLRCIECKRYDDPANLKIPNSTCKGVRAYHAECVRIRYHRNRAVALTHERKSA